MEKRVYGTVMRDSCANAAACAEQEHHQQAFHEHLLEVNNRSLPVSAAG